MEDSFSVLAGPGRLSLKDRTPGAAQPAANDWTLMGVYDGHGGTVRRQCVGNRLTQTQAASHYAEQHLLPALNAALPVDGTDVEVASAFRNAFHSLDEVSEKCRRVR
jgi:hypothetical protein